MEKRLAGIVAVIFASFMIASCSSTNDNGSIDPEISDISGGSEGADVTVGDYGDNYKLSPEERAKLEALQPRLAVLRETTLFTLPMTRMLLLLNTPISSRTMLGSLLPILRSTSLFRGIPMKGVLLSTTSRSVREEPSL